MGNIYRKASMDRLSSPEQLDKLILIASPSLWISVVGAALVVICVLIWAILGRLPENVSVSGLYMSNTGTQGAYASHGGEVIKVLARKGQQVQAGDTLVVVTNKDADLTLEQLQDRIKAVKAVTLDSKSDQATSDNSKLLEYKLQYQQAGMTLEQKQTSLNALKKQLEDVKKQVSAYKANMKAAENAYLAAVGDDGANSATFNYQKAQEVLQTAQSRYQTAYSSVSSLESSYATAEQSLQTLQQQYDNLQSQYQTLKSSYDSQISELNTGQQQYQALMEQYGDGEIPDEVQQQLAALEKTISALTTSSDSLGEQMASTEESMVQIESNLGAQEIQYETLHQQLSTARSELGSAEAEVNSAQSALDSAESIYSGYYSSQNSRTAEQTRLNTAFSEASTRYSNAYSQQQSLEQQVKELSLENGFEADNKNVNKDTLKEQFTATKEAMVKDLESQLASYRAGGAVDEVKAQVSGTVIDCAAQKGQILGQGAEVAKIKSGTYQEEEKEIVRCYVPLAEGKKLEKGMEVVVTPSTVDEQEYGHMTAQVLSVGAYTVSTIEMQQMLGDDTMVQAFQQQGPSVEVLISLDKDPGTASGYAWSNKKGKSVELKENTLVSAKVRTKDEAPISKLIPFLKQKLEVKTTTDAEAS